MKKRLFRYLSLLRPHLVAMGAVLLLMFLSTGISLAIPIKAGEFVDYLAQAPSLMANPKVFMVLGFLLVAQLLSSFLNGYIASRLGINVITNLRRRLFSHMLSLPSLYFTHKKAGDLSSRMTSDVGSIQYMLTSGIVGGIRAIVTLVGAVFLMFQLNLRLTMVVVMLVPTTIILVSLFGKRLRKLSRKMYDDLGELSNHVQEVAGAIRTIKVFDSEPHEQSRFDGRLFGYRDNGFRRALLTSALEASSQILMWTCLIVVVTYGFYLSGQGKTTYGELVSFMLLTFRLAMPMGSLTSLYTSAQGASAAADRLDSIFATTPEYEIHDVQDRGELVAVGHGASAAGTLRMENLSFSYPPDPDADVSDAPPPRTILQNVTTTLPAGSRTALVGPSGAGKTTLASLVLRLFTPDEGEIYLNDRPYSDFDLHELRRGMAYVSQESLLYDAAIGDNIRFGFTAASDDEVREAARRANALEFIDRLPEGFGTHVGDRGVRLSGGERQRITLARAFLRNPEILVLDEPTSALDARSEEAVRGALMELMEGRTTIVVAHRLSLVRDLDRILVLDQGRLVEEGAHEELMATGGLYSQLFDLQQGRG